MRTIADYLAKISRFHASQPKYMAMLAMALQPFSDLQSLLKNLPQYFDVDQAVGVQLDVCGEWVGAKRNVNVPLPDMYFSFDDPKLVRGWDRGIWKGPYDTPTGISKLDDETYRSLIKAKIAANTWDGTTPSAQTILQNFFAMYPGTLVFVEDNGDSPLLNNFFTWDDPSSLRCWDAGVWYQPGQSLANISKADMAMVISVSGMIPSIAMLEILAQNLIPLKPVGVKSDVRVTSVDGTPVFGFDCDNQWVGGWDHGSWPVSPALLANL